MYLVGYFFVLHIAALNRHVYRWALHFFENKKGYWFRVLAKYFFVFVLQQPVAAVLSKVQIKFVTLM